MPKEPIPTWFFVVVVVQRDDRILLVHERKHGQRWYLPAGRVEPGESIVAAAVRETMEEAGIPIRLTGLLRIEHTPRANATRIRVVLAAEPADATPPKSIADEHSLKAAWVNWDDLSTLTLRGDDVEKVFGYLMAGGTIFPLSILQPENASYSLRQH
jgi:phosphatase NudJ